ncbi:LysR family transcriptional regulator [Crossiella sp. S99.1]|uniref:LysR family transcriptional regulator n=1 Tax=Crossiella sp. S99.1 TaxID=2936271 RepID=UPI001FFF5ED0|nr:LysR family transcriptional regulator [Crossiella sp. S99.1]MCK2241478.1 LysR family transcriptional regulator [Crossiella sp. S99.2]MCK2255650.1 LysR family transcriptional regulator [Crossiella sp. S99.1]
MVTVRQLECFVGVVDSGTFTAAAEVLLLTQPALSRSVRELERVVGAPLLERLPRGVELTAVGRAVLPAARSALAEARRVREIGRRAAGLLTGELHVAVVQSLTLGALLPVVRLWREEHPEVELRITEFTHRDHLEQVVRDGFADVAVSPRPRDWDGPVRELGTEEFVLILPTGESAPVGERLPVAGLAQRRWVHFDPVNGLAEVVDRTCAAAGFSPIVSVRTAQTSAAPRLAAAGLGVALVPANILVPTDAMTVAFPEPAVRRPVAAFTRRAPDPMAGAFLELLERAAAVVPAFLPAPPDRSVGE